MLSNTKIPSPTVVLWIFASIFVLTGCGSDVSEKKQPLAKLGVLDLRGWDFSKDGPVKLNGEWEFYWEQLLSANDFRHVILPRKTGMMNLPGTWNGYEIDGEKLTGDGYATYRLSVLLDSPSEFMAFKVNMMLSASDIIVNSKLVDATGTVGITKSMESPTALPHVVNFSLNKKTIEIIVHISNFHYSLGGVWHPIILGNQQDINKQRENYLNLELFIIGGIFMMGIYHLGIFVQRKQDLSALYFAVFCFLLVLLNITTGELYLLHIFPEINWELFVKLSFLSSYLALPVFILFINKLFWRESSTGFIYFSLFVGIVFSLITLFTQARIHSQILLTFNVIVLIAGCYVVYVLIHAAAQKRDGAAAFIFGSLIFFGCLINDLLDFHGIISTGRFASFGLLALIFAQSFLLSMRFSKAFAHSQQLSTRLQRLDKLKDEFLANTSHELRTPINGIIGIVESLIDGATGQLQDNTKSNLKLVVASGQRLSNLVNDILDFSKLKNQDIALQIKPVDLRALVEVVTVLSKPLIKAKDLNIKNLISENTPSVDADENRIQQVMFNLIGNAVKFTESGEITISAARKNQSVYLSVQDTGIGIAEDRIAQIFESFEQADGSTAREYGGTGLGLSISRKLVQLHGGDIQVISKIDEGSVFSFSLPISTGEVMASPEPAILHALLDDVPDSEDALQNDRLVDMAENQNSGHVILIVDDEPVNIQVLQNQLTLHNYQILAANDGLQALEQLAKTKLDLILLDLMMPKMSGYEVCQKIRETHDAVILPIIMLTAKNQVDNMVAGLNCGANDYLTKPFHKDELLARIQSQIQFSNAVQSLKQQEYFKLELETAQHVQKLFIPDNDPCLSGIDIASFYRSASQTGGDWYDYREQHNKQTLDVLIGDVTGHGVPAALITAVVNSFYLTIEQHKLTLTNLDKEDDLLLQPIYLLQQLNNVLHHTTSGSYNMTFFYSNLDLQTNVLTYSSAAHVPCYVYRPEKFTILQRGKEIKRSMLSLTTPGTILGKLPNQHYQLDHCQLQLDDVLIWFTDGLTENKNGQGKMFGNRELKGVVKSSAHLSAQQIKDNIIAAAYHHYGETPCDDDVTLIIGKIEA